MSFGASLTRWQVGLRFRLLHAGRWGDFIATVLRHGNTTVRDDEFVIGAYANNGTSARAADRALDRGIRKYPYTTSMTANPTTYAYTRRRGYGGVHAKGEVWAQILYEVYWNLVDRLGFSPDWYASPGLGDDGCADYLDLSTGERAGRAGRAAPAGNTVMLQLVLDGMKMQSCYPSFIDARDAIMQAEAAAWAGVYACDLWKGFAKRGLGRSAKSGGREAFDLPEQCGEKKPKRRRPRRPVYTTNDSEL